MKKKKQYKEIYINDTVSMWGGHNGEVNFELEGGMVLTFNAYNLMRDLPSIVQLTFDEVAKEKQHFQERYKELAKFITK